MQRAWTGFVNISLDAFLVPSDYQLRSGKQAPRADGQASSPPLPRRLIRREGKEHLPGITAMERQSGVLLRLRSLRNGETA